MPRLFLHQLSARALSHELTRAKGLEAPASFDAIPDARVEAWASRGHSHAWLMGVWPTGPRSREQALQNADLRRAYDEALPGWTEKDVWGSPYAVARYEVDPRLGGAASLARLRARLHRAGLGLVVDFVPNHVGLDHPLLRKSPRALVCSSSRFEGSFELEGGEGVRFVAHGRDPYFPPWTDTAQLDYRTLTGRKAMKEALLSVAEIADGVRCDMAMLVLDPVFRRTWKEPPPRSAELTPEGSEFWGEAIAEVKARRKNFVFVAEAYWGLEERLLELGFDAVYDKAFFDHVVARRGEAAAAHLRAASRGTGLGRRLHFLENHDEPRAASSLALPEHRAALLALLTLPGSLLLHEGQLEGRRVFARVQLRRWAPEPEDGAVRAMYEDVFSALETSGITGMRRRGAPGWLLTPRAAGDGAEGAEALVVSLWPLPRGAFALAASNLGSRRASARFTVALEGQRGLSFRLRDELDPASAAVEIEGAALAAPGLLLDLPPHGARLLVAEPTWR